MSPGDLNSILLFKVMKRLGDLRSEYTKDHTTRALFDLVPEVISGKGQEHTIGYLYQHLLFLQGCGLVLLKGRFCRIGLCTIELTAQGNMFVQPAGWMRPAHIRLTGNCSRKRNSCRAASSDTSFELRPRSPTNPAGAERVRCRHVLAFPNPFDESDDSDKNTEARDQ
jgi:hypothetical protein